MSTIKRPVSVGDKCDCDRGFTLYDADGFAVANSFDDDELNEIAAALNVTADGTFDWAWKWMVENKDRRLTCFDGYYEYWIDSDIGGLYMAECEHPSAYEPARLSVDVLEALDWRIAEVG